MKTHLSSLLAAVALVGLLAGCQKSDSQAGPGVVLRAKWPVGHRYVYRMDLDQHSFIRIPQMPKPMKQEVTMAMTYALTVVKETADGGREIELEFLANEMEVKVGDQVMLSFDSKESLATAPQNALATPLRKMIGSEVTLTVGPDGKVTGLMGVDEWVDNLTDEGDQAASQMLSQHFNEGFLRQLADFGQGFSSQPVAVGRSWPVKATFPAGPNGNIAIEAKVTLKRWEDRDQHHCAVLDSRGTMNGALGGQAGPVQKLALDKGRISATSWFDADLGTVIETVSDQSMRLKGELPGGPGGGKAEFTSDIEQRVSVKLVELTGRSETNGTNGESSVSQM